MINITNKRNIKLLFNLFFCFVPLELIAFKAYGLPSYKIEILPTDANNSYFDDAYATSINDSGTVVGNHWLGWQSANKGPVFIYHNGATQPLDLPFDNYNDTLGVLDIANDGKLLIGYAEYGYIKEYAFWNDGVLEQPAINLNAFGMIGLDGNWTDDWLGGGDHTTNPMKLSVSEQNPYNILDVADNGDYVHTSRLLIVKHPDSYPPYYYISQYRGGAVLSGIDHPIEYRLDDFFSTYVTALNNRKVAVGYISDNYLGGFEYSDLGFPFIYKNQTILLLKKPEHFTSVKPKKINDSGHIVALAYDANKPGVSSFLPQSMLLYSPGGHVQELELFGLNTVPEVKAMNNRGQILTSCCLYTGGKIHSLASIITNLPPSTNGILISAMDINNHGQIVGSITIDGKMFPFLATPTNMQEPADWYRKFNRHSQAYQWLRYIVDVPKGTTELKVEIKDGPGDVALYVRHVNPPWRSLYDCKRTTPLSTVNNHKRCVIQNPAEGIWHIGLLSERDFEGVTLRVEHK